ncbi:tRNA 2-thiouridine(34) synthase MnmA [Thermoflavifilum thermophilum]|uniref:tRNA-specific 2-thiouridylase MnmA n=1 Tax=Thermoflavifilum thermophilum TaxID=1393122 RepID=A0A1I7NGT9_9BACT|nr:tRNA 2-thiouridine(34) synthase MnmA [Thermoflavifilum thermophilum]SFV33833.1 tRNA-specific 2-thiouridylase [Thermoflavifilum thermophilum]
MSKHGRVLVAMSGGVDSTVAALMLHDQGYEVVGVTMKTWDYATSGSSKKETGCCNLDSFNDARAAAVKHGFPHYIIDIREEFGHFVINNFIEEYLSGRTPNPCILCNTHIKWEALLRRADALHCDYIATGHYVNLKYENGRYFVSKGVDENKDQSYVMWGLSQECLSRTIFPLGKYHKTEIREMALAYGFPELARKSESYEICFIPDNDYRGFLKRKVEGLESQTRGGKLVWQDGTVVGEHEGYPFYTVGQRKGLGVALGKPAYVTDIIPETNTVVLGEERDLYRPTMEVYKLNWMKYPGLNADMQATIKVRYRDRGTPGVLHAGTDPLRVDFDTPVKGIAPGQSAVFYEGDDVIGGGIILRSVKEKH